MNTGRVLRAASFLALIHVLASILAFGADPAAASARREALTSFREDQLPTDTASDGKTLLSIEERPELGGKALKVVYSSGDAFGDRVARVKDWKPFIALEFDALNPAQEDVKLTLTVRHRRTTSYPTRVDVPIVLKPGKSAVKIGIDEMVNVNGSLPDLSSVVRWYLACEEGKTPTLYFGDLYLLRASPATHHSGTSPHDPPRAPTEGGSRVPAEKFREKTLSGDDAPAQPPSGAVDRALPGPAQAYRVTGKIGDMDVDLTVTPAGAPVPAPGSGSGSGARAGAPRADPERLARIRAAKMPPISKPVMFHTTEADAILSALEVFPPDNPWNQVVADWPVHPDSARIIASIGAEKPLRYNPDMAFILVPPDQPRLEVKIADYPGESDKGPFPVPDGIPIEGWPVYYEREWKGATLTLEEVQRDKLGKGGDRHGIVVDPVNRMLHEFFVLRRTDGGWQAAQASTFDLKTNALRPDGWTSADAAGLPIFPAVVRHDELQRGIVEHAMRVTVTRTRREYVAPATHFASRHENKEYPRMGERIRLRGDFDISGFSKEVQAILKGLKKYGMFVADNGIDWAISVAPDPRIPSLHEELRRVKGAAFEVVTLPE